MLIPVGLLFLGALALAFFFGRSPICITPVEPRLTRATVERLEAGISRFQEVHRRLPFPSSLLDETGRVRTEGAWLGELLRLPSIDGQGIFLEFQHGKAGLAGLVETKEGWAVVDAWGESFYLVLSDAIGLPKASESPTTKDAETTESIMTHKPKVLVYSAGPDRDPSTWNDNIRSW